MARSAVNLAEQVPGWNLGACVGHPGIWAMVSAMRFGYLSDGVSVRQV